MKLGWSGSSLATIFLLILSPWVLSDLPSSEGALICINAGGNEVVDHHGTTFEADVFYSGGSTSFHNHEIHQTTDDILFKSERWGSFSYSVPLATDDYLVTLYFAEIYFQASTARGGPGSRVFDIFLEDQLVEENFDILSNVASKTAMSRTNATSIEDGDLTLSFALFADYPKLSGLCIHKSNGDYDGGEIGDNDDSPPVPEASDYEICVNSGGPYYATAGGTEYLADDYYTGGRTSTFRHDIANTADDPIYQSERWGAFSYSIPVPQAGSYTLELEFAEIYYQARLSSGGPGSRVFDVVVGGDLAATSFDILAQVPSKTALTLSYTTVVENNELNIEFGVLEEWPKLSAFCVRANSGDPDPDPDPDPEPEPEPETGSDGDGSGENTDPNPLPDTPDYEMCINAGGPAYTTAGGIDYQADTYYTGDRTSTHRHNIANTADAPIYQTERWGAFSYSVPVPQAGTYSIDLEFAEIYFQASWSLGGPGSRVFDVYVENELIADSFDILAQVPSKTALTLRHATLVEDGSLDIGFGVINDWPKLSAFCVRSSFDGTDTDTDTEAGGDGVGDNPDTPPDDPSQPQFSEPFDVLFVKGTGVVNSIAKAQSLIDNPGEYESVSLSSDVISFSGGSDGNTGIFADSAAFPFDDHFAMYAKCSVWIQEAGEYTFLVRSDDGARLIIDGEIVINDDKTHAVANTVAAIYLEEGMIQVELIYFEAAGAAVVELAAAKGSQYDFNLVGVESMAAVADRVDAVLTLPVLAPRVGGEWGEVVQWPEIPVSAAQLPDGKLLTWVGGTENSDGGTKSTASIYDPASGSFQGKDHATHNQFCSGIALMEDGSIFNSGGNPANKKTSRFDIESMSWVPLDEMSYPRWYPTTLTMPDNRVFTAFAKGSGNTSEIYSNVQQQWLDTPGATMQSLVDEQNLINSAQFGNGSTDMQWYAFMHVGPNGRVFQSGPMQTMHWFDTEGQGDVEQIGARLGGDQARMFGSAVMYDVGKILITGGNDPSEEEPSSNKAITVDLNGATPVIQEIAPMHHKRTFHDSVVLPDGRVMVIGGTTVAKLFSDEGSIIQPEIWDPETGHWTTVNNLTIPRNYHSTALLMKDGRVFAGGGGACGGCDVNHQDAQFYSPDYLFDGDNALGARPNIIQAPAQVSAGSLMTIKTSGAIAQFNMIRLQGTTHSMNTDQRFVPLEFGGSGGDYTVEVNPNPNVMIPGYYWLFAVDDQGIPSEGFAIQIVRGGDPLDSDGDGFVDAEDAIPNDPTEGEDIDGDGSPNDEDGSSDDSTEWADTDGDGVGDNADFYPNDPTRYAMPPLPVLNSTTLAVEPVIDVDRVWVVNPDNNSVSLVIGDQRTSEVSVGEKPSSIALSADGSRAWVSNKSDATISVIDTNSEMVVNTVPLPTHSQPHGLVRVPGSDDLLVVLEATAQLIRLDLATAQIVTIVDLPGRPRHLAVSSDGETVYVTNFITPPMPGEDGLDVDVSSGGGELFIIDAQTLLVMETINLGYLNRGVSESSGPGLPNYLNAPVLGPDGDWAYVPSKQDNILAGAARGGPGMTFDQTVRAVTSRVNLATRTENPGVRIDHDNASLATGAVVTADGRYLFVALETSREVAVYNLEDGYQLTRLATGLAPQGLALSADGERLLIHNFMDRSLQSFDLAPIIVDNLPQADPLHTVALVSAETLLPDVLLGKQLFYDAADNRLARDNYMSCASCHNDGGHDGRVWDLTSLGQGVRNTIDLTGKGAGHGLHHWTGNFADIQDFESQIRSLAGGTGLIDDIDFNAGDDPLSTSRAGLSSDMDAIASYLESLVGYPPSPFYRETLSAEAAAGQEVYQRENCSSCHSGEQRTDSNMGVVHDIGTLTTATGFNNDGPVYGIDTPTLNHLWATSPYLHNGAAGSIAEAILAHDNLNITELEAEGLELYLLEVDEGQQ